MRRAEGCAVLALAACGLGAGPDWTVGAYFALSQPSAVGGEGALSAQFQPLEDHELLIGPRVGFLLAGASQGRTRWDLNIGVAETLWVLNAVGGGVDLDVVAPSMISGEDASVHFRVTPNLAIRLARRGEEGAWAVRIGVPYDSAYRWGLQAGMTLQFNGVSGPENYSGRESGQWD